MLPYGAGAQNFGVKTYAETADQLRAATIVGNDKFVVSDTQKIPAPVPEGVQGKEPQTPDTSPILTGEDATRFLEAMRLAAPISAERFEYLKQCARESIAAEKEGVSPDEQRAYKSGEAAGRRSAITELQERITSQVKGKHAGYHTFSSDCHQCGVETASIVMTNWCSELQEKTK